MPAFPSGLTELPAPAAADVLLIQDVSAGTYHYVTAANLAGAGSHTHTSSEITDFAEAVDDRVDALLVAGEGIAITYDDALGTLTISTSGGGGSGSGGSSDAGAGVRLTNSIAQTLAAGGGGLTLSFGTEVFDPAGLHDPADPTKITIQEHGYYLVAGRCQFGATTLTGASSHSLSVLVNNSSVAQETSAFSSGGNSFTVSVDTLCELQPGDSLTLKASSNATSDDAIGGGQNILEFSAVKVA